MDLSFIETLIPDFAKWLGLQPETLLFLIGFVMANCHIIGKLIPDDATGWKGYIREICKILGMGLSNRLTAGVTQAQVARSILGVNFDRSKQNKVVEMASDSASAIPQVVDEITEDSPRLVKDPIGQYARTILKHKGEDH